MKNVIWRTENEIAAKFPPKCSVKSSDQKAKAASPVLRHWELKPPSHPNAPLTERLLVYSTSRIAANPTTERSVMKHMSDLGLEDCGGRHRLLAVKLSLVFACVCFI